MDEILEQNFRVFKIEYFELKPDDRIKRINVGSVQKHKHTHTNTIQNFAFELQSLFRFINVAMFYQTDKTD